MPQVFNGSCWASAGNAIAMVIIKKQIFSHKMVDDLSV
jgi:hypothetical protein